MLGNCVDHRMKTKKLDKNRRLGLSIMSVALIAVVQMAEAQTVPSLAGQPKDPGVRAGTPGAGGPLVGLGPLEINAFLASSAVFARIDSVSGTLAGEPGSGLGARFNGNACGQCHAFPALGGTSPFVNPQLSVASLDGAMNTIPAFLEKHGPVREARFLKNPDGTPDGSVHDLFVITGRTDAKGCTIKQPNFAAEIAVKNVSLRIPTPVFGLGLIEAVSDRSLMAADVNHTSVKNAYGIKGHFQHSPNDNTISRFGWKAQNKSLLLFAGEAYNVEMGVSNELFPNVTEDDPNCQFNPIPEDATVLAPSAMSVSPSVDFSSDIVNFAQFMRLSAQPTPAPSTPSIANGHTQFVKVGCEACHFETFHTAQSLFTKQSNVEIHPFSDFEVHSMGTGLADGVTQGSANGDQFRTAPLWGVGQRIFFLHDGRTNDLLGAIKAHAGPGSEANAVINRFNALSPSQQQDLLNFLRSL